MSTVTAARARAAPLAVARSVPAWAWLATLVAVSTLVRYAFARRMPAPWIMVDELIYSELAKSFAATGSFAVREVAAGGAYGVVYPILISPAYALFDAVPTAYAAAKAINAVLVSLTAVPVYLLARTVLRPALALLAAALSLAIPSTLYAGTLMTENAFYPLFALAALALVRALERPSPIRVAILLAVASVAFLTRAQALVLVPAILTAPLLLVLLERGGLRALRRFAVLYAGVAGAVLAVLAVQAVRGGSPSALLGAYASTRGARYEPSEVARWLLYHVAELDLYLGVIPFAALVILVAVAPRLEERDRRFVAASLALAAWLLPVVAAFASRYALRIEERNTFYLAPLFFVALLVWIERGVPRPRRAAPLAAVVAAVLPTALPFARLVDVSAQSDTLALLAWWRLHEAGIPLDSLALAAGLLAAALAALVLSVPERLALALPALVLVLYAAALQPIEAGEHGVRRASIGALFQGMTVSNRDWIDHAVGRDARVDAIWTGRGDRLVVNENEFFNRSLRRVFYLGQPTPGGLPEARLTLDAATGLFRTADGGTVRSKYAFAERSLQLAGAIVASDPRRGTAVTRISNPLGTTRRIDGLYDDRWSAPTLLYTRYRCRGGSLAVALDGDQNLFPRAQTVRALVAGREVARVRVPPGAARTLLTVPLRRGAGGICRVRFTVAPTAVPGGGDTRRLGTHFRSFRYSARAR